MVSLLKSYVSTPFGFLVPQIPLLIVEDGHQPQDAPSHADILAT